MDFQYEGRRGIRVADILAAQFRGMSLLRHDTENSPSGLRNPQWLPAPRRSGNQVVSRRYRARLDRAGRL